MKKIIVSVLLILPSVSLYLVASDGNFDVLDYLGGQQDPQGSCFSSYYDDMPEELAQSLLEYAPESIKEIVAHLGIPSIPEKDKTKTLFLYGPSGTGKTELCVAIAKVLKLPLTMINASTIGDRYQHSAANDLKKALAPVLAAGTKQAVLVDEMTCLLEEYDEGANIREKNSTTRCLWTAIDDCIASKKVLFMGTANTMDRLPEMFQTRFATEIIKVDLPGKLVRRSIIKFYLPKSHGCSSSCIERVVCKTEGCPARVLKKIIQTATRKAQLRKGVDGKMIDVDLIKALDMHNFPDHYVIAFCKKHKSEIVHGLFRTAEFSLALFQAYMSYKNGHHQEKSIMMQGKGLDLQQSSLHLQRDGFQLQEEGLDVARESLNLAQQGLDCQRQQIAHNEHLQSYEGMLDHSKKEIQVKTTHGAVASAGSVAGAVIGTAMGVGPMIGAAAGGSLAYYAFIAWEPIKSGACWAKSFFA